FSEGAGRLHARLPSHFWAAFLLCRWARKSPHNFHTTLTRRTASVNCHHPLATAHPHLSQCHACETDPVASSSHRPRRLPHVTKPIETTERFKQTATINTKGFRKEYGG